MVSCNIFQRGYIDQIALENKSFLLLEVNTV